MSKLVVVVVLGIVVGVGVMMLLYCDLVYVVDIVMFLLLFV